MTRRTFGTKIARSLKAIALTTVGTFALATTAMVGAVEAKERYALIIANKTYEHTGNVDYAHRDAEAIKKALINTLGFSKDNIEVEYDQTFTNLRYLFGQPGRHGKLANMITGDDSELFVYFAGHGSKDTQSQSDPVPYLLGTDSRPDGLKDTAYSLNVLTAQLNDLQQTRMPKGRIMLVLESCFSGTSYGGDLITGRSAPAFGAPAIMTAQTLKTNNNFVVLAAAQGNQMAVWDREYKRSVFTDALVSGLYGEADAKRFNGNADGDVTLSELRSFVSSRVSRRLRALDIKDRQDPDIKGGDDTMTLVKTAELKAEWSELVTRSYGEKFKARMLMRTAAMPDIKAIEGYLSDCLYCFNDDELRDIVRKEKRKAAICKIENDFAAGLLIAGRAAELEAHLASAQCKNFPLRTKLSKRLKQLRRLASLTKATTTTDATAPSVVEPVVKPAPEADEAEAEENRKASTRVAKRTDTEAESDIKAGNDITGTTTPEAVSTGDDATTTLSKYELATRLQTELKRVGCLAGRIDGKWGRGSRRALQRYAKRANADFSTSDGPSLEIITAVTKQEEPVCNAIANVPKTPKFEKKNTKKKKWRRANRTKDSNESYDKPKSKKRKSRRKEKVIYEEYTPKKKRKKKYVEPTYKKKTYKKKWKPSNDGGTYKPYKKPSGGGVYNERQCSKYGNFCG